jgi:hypothetical protein
MSVLRDTREVKGTIVVGVLDYPDQLGTVRESR